jgi:hypothetical protein
MLVLPCHGLLGFQSRNVSSEPPSELIQKPQPNTFTKLKALLIGIDNYDLGHPQKKCGNANAQEGDPEVSLKDLVGARKDVEAIKKWLEVLFPNPQQRQIVTMVDDQVTTEKLRKQMVNLLVDSVETDLIFLSFSGHGTLDQQTPYLMMYDSDPRVPTEKSYAFKDFLSVFQGHSSAGGRVLLLDACKSGSLSQSSVLANEAFIQAREESQLNGNNPNESSLFLMASRGNQDSQEDCQGGFFTQAFVRGAMGLANLGVGSGTVTFEDIFTYANLETRFRTGGDQDPYFSGSQLKGYLPKLSQPCNLLSVSTSNTTHHYVENDLHLEIMLPPHALLVAWNISEISMVWQINRRASQAGSLPWQRSPDWLDERERISVLIPSAHLRKGTFSYFFRFHQGNSLNGETRTALLDSERCQYQIRLR